MNREKSARWCVTMWDFNKVVRIRKHLLNHYVIGKEICPTTHKLHFQCYFEFKKLYDLGNVKRVLCDKEAHCEIAREPRAVCEAYCAKDGCLINLQNGSEDSSSECVFCTFGIKSGCSCGC